METVLLALLSGALGSLITFAIQANFDRKRQLAEAALLVTGWLDDLYAAVIRMRLLRAEQRILGRPLREDQLEVYRASSNFLLGEAISSLQRARVAVLWGEGKEYELLTAIQERCRTASRILRSARPEEEDFEKQMAEVDDLMDEADSMREDLIQRLVDSGSVPLMISRIKGEF